MINKYRPQHIDEIIGNGSIKHSIAMAIQQGKLPHAILFTGESGCGKTTFAKCIANALKCAPTAFHEINCGATGGKEKTLSLIEIMKIKPLYSNVTVFIFDEAQALTADSQRALLEPIEKLPEWVYVILCSNEPNKLNKALKNRFVEYKVSKLDSDHLTSLIENIWTKEKKLATNKEAIIKLIVQKADGVPRTAIALLSKLSTHDIKEAKEIISNYVDVDKEIIDLARLFVGRPSWKDVASLYIKLRQNGVQDESIRILMARYFLKIHLKTPQYGKLKILSTRLDEITPEVDMGCRLYELCYTIKEKP